jgi:cystathionine beta-lyase
VATKYPGGHSDLLLGAVVANEAWWPRLRDTARDLGQNASPDDLFLALRGFRTLEVRMQRHQASAMDLALRLRGHSKVRRVLYPALDTDPGHALWKRDFLGASGLFAIELAAAGRAEAARFVDALEGFELGYSWGGFQSLVAPVNPGRADRVVRKWEGGPLVRLSIGLEDPDDLWADLEQALAKV